MKHVASIKQGKGEKVMELRRFEKSDWYGFAGAENFSDGTLPLIGEGQNFLLVADASGIEIDLDDSSSWLCNSPVDLMPGLARLIANGLPDRLSHKELTELGFQMVGSPDFGPDDIGLEPPCDSSL
jgi:hypothetical protein